MLYTDTLLNYPEWKIPFTLHTDDSDKQLGAIISNNNKQIALFSILSNNLHSNYTTIYKEILSIV